MIRFTSSLRQILSLIFSLLQYTHSMIYVLSFLCFFFYLWLSSIETLKKNQQNNKKNPRSFMPGNITPVSFIKKKKKNSYITCKLLYLRQAFLLSCPAVAEYSVFYYHLIKKNLLEILLSFNLFLIFIFANVFTPWCTTYYIHANILKSIMLGKS